jgi:pyruvate,water dikinase
MPDVLFFDEITDAVATLVGGKGLSLGKTATAGLPVPAGFVVTTQAYRRLVDRGVRADAGFARALAGPGRAKVCVGRQMRTIRTNIRDTD